jgi:hypothetical protein
MPGKCAVAYANAVHLKNNEKISLPQKNELIASKARGCHWDVAAASRSAQADVTRTRRHFWNSRATVPEPCRPSGLRGFASVPAYFEIVR